MGNDQGGKRDLSKLSILPFGAQYYRAPTPVPADWARDVKNIAGHGFTAIKIWAVWRANNPREGVWDFHDLDALLGLAADHGLKVIVNLVFDAAPAWFLQKYPESLMVLGNGDRVAPVANACRQMGGAPGPCLHHPEGIETRRGFVRRLAQRYHGHPALLCWDLWNEPEHTCGVKREPTPENLTCYCEASIKEFKAWLREKYGDVKALNAAWNMNYADFAEVEAPRRTENFKPMVDWRLFMADAVTNECKMRVAAVKEFDLVHPVMVHTVTIPFFPLATCGSDDYDLAAQCDIFGNSVGSEPLSAAITLSAAPDKMVINSEIHAMGGSTYERPAPLSLEDVKRHVYLPLSLGIKGFLFWQYRPERLGLESPAWGLTDLEGNMTPWLEAAVKVNAALQENAAVILNASRPRAQVAVLNSKRSQLFDFCVDHRRQMYVYSVKGAYAMSRSRGYATDVVGEAQMTPAFLARYSVLYDPFPYYKDAKTCAVLRQWVENGGTLVAECCFGGYSDDDGLHTTRQPGFGFDKVFGAVEGQATTASHFQNAYGEEWPQAGAAADVVDIVARGAALGAPADETYKGCCFYQSIRPTSANCAVIATFRDGAAAAVCAQYGRGRAIWLGSLVALAYERLGKVENARFLDRLIASFSPVRPEFATSDDRVVCAALSAPEGCLLAVDNQSSRADVAISCDRARLNGAVLKNILGGDAFPIVTVAGDAGGQGSRARVDLAIRPGGIEVFKVCQ